MPRNPDVPCAGGCGHMCWRSKSCRPPGEQMCRACRYGSIKPPKPPVNWIRNVGATCLDVKCCKPARKRGLCSTHYNKATGHYIGTLPKDPERERARQRIRTHRRKDWSRLTDITPEYELGLRKAAKKCSVCTVKMTERPFLPHSKELDHIVPRNVGGTHTIGNVRIICRSCNGARPKDGSDYSGPVTLWAEVA